VDLGGDVGGECVVVLAKVGELSLPIIAPDAEACGVKFGVETCGEEISECGVFGFHILIFGFLFFVVAVVASIWDDYLINLFSRQQLFFKKMKIILEACGAA
jgi:hypothetical protein